jgi:hypothetical protein
MDRRRTVDWPSFGDDPRTGTPSFANPARYRCGIADIIARVRLRSATTLAWRLALGLPAAAQAPE